MGASSLVPDGSIDLDWAFYQHRFGPASVKVGRFPSAVGIYNEVRDVGTLIPFYRPPASVYMEGFETVDGAMVSAGHALGKWFFDGTVYGGGADFAGQTVTPTETFGYTQRLEGTIGVQAWIATPIPGVRAGASSTWFDFDVEGLGERAGSMTVLSADVSRDRMQVRGEYSFLEVEDVTKMNSWYAQAGVRTWRDLWLNAQYEATDTESPTATGMVSEETLRDAALGVSYKFSPRVVFKFEGHDRKGYDFDSYVDRAGERAESRYWITSVSVAF